MKKIIFLAIFLIAQVSVATDVPTECAKEGDRAGGSTLDAPQCCPGLKQTNKWLFENSRNNCKAYPPPGSDGACIKCGDGKCDTKNYETKCVCPKDCK